MCFGERLRELRKENSKSQKDFGKMFGLSESAIGMYERNERKPDFETLTKIADFFGVSIDYLIGRSANEELNKEEQQFLDDLDFQGKNLNIEELINKYNLTIDGKMATKKEIEGAIAFIRSLRSLK